MNDPSPPPGNNTLPAWALPADWLLHDDGDVVAVYKPPGVSVTAPERSKHDLLARARMLRASRTNEDDYLCPHMHLDRDASGVVVFAGRRESNASLARPDALSVTYLVALRPHKRFDAEGTLTTHVAKDRSGVLRPAHANAKGAKSISVQYRVVDRRRDRALLEARCKEGARAIRAAFASMGTAIAGDVAFDGPEANRLMVHAMRVLFDHPRSGYSTQIDSPAPWAFDAWLRELNRAVDLDAPALEAALREASASRYALIAEDDVDAIRLVHGEGEGLDGLDVECFGRHLVLWVHDEATSEALDRIVDAVSSLGSEGTYAKVRPKQASRIVHARDAELVTPHAVRGRDAPDPLVVHEGDLAFFVRLGEGLGTGLFLDQRPNRKWIRAHCRDKTVLNLFAYTCAFTVAAAAGGARQTVSVDISKNALELGARNLELNGIAPASHALVCEDVLAWVERARREGRRFDVVVLDPPSFGTSHRGRFTAMRDYVGLAAACMSLLDDAGVLLACTNHRGVRRKKLWSWLQAAAAEAARGVVKLEDAPTALDFPHRAGREPHMKAVICQLGTPKEAAGEPAGTAGGRSSNSSRTTRRRGRSSINRGGRR